jgi:hypothetical protein
MLKHVNSLSKYRTISVKRYGDNEIHVIEGRKGNSDLWTILQYGNADCGVFAARVAPTCT